MGLIIDSANLAEDVVQEFEEELKPENSWQALLDNKGRLFWKAGGHNRSKGAGPFFPAAFSIRHFRTL